MAVKQNGVLATFTPTVSDYTNLLVAANNNAIATNGWCMYTCPTATLASAKLIIANNTGSAANIDVGIVEQTDVIQFDALNQQPGTPQNYGAFAFPSGTATFLPSSSEALALVIPDLLEVTHVVPPIPYSIATSTKLIGALALTAFM